MSAESYRPNLELLLTSGRRLITGCQIIEDGMDYPHLIGDCLIHVFTFLNEEDLVGASSVCQVSSVQLAEVARHSRKGLNNGVYFCRIGMKLQRAPAYGGEFGLQVF